MSSKEKQFAIYIIVGKDAYLIQCAIDQIRKTINDNADVIRFDGKKSELADVLDELRTVAMFTNNKLVIVENADQFISKNRSALEEYFDNPSDVSILVLICDSWRKGTKLDKKIGKKAKLISAEPLQGAKLANWLCDYARTQGKILLRHVADDIINIVGTEMGRLVNELDKLITFVGSRKEITLEDIEQLCGPTAQQSIFAITDKLADGNIKDALKIFNKILENDRTAEFTIVGVMTYSLRRLLKAKAMLISGKSKRDICSQLRIYPSIADRFFQQLDRFTLNKLEILISHLTKLDYDIKTGLGHGRTNMEKFIICSA